MKALRIPGLTTDDDVRWLARQAATREAIVEIGAYQGRSTRALGDATSGVVYAIDNWNASFTDDGHGDRSIRSAFLAHCADLLARGTVVLLEQPSGQGLPARLAGLAVDMLWIDGDHSFEAVTSDLQTYAPRVARGGLICGHDYSVWHPEVVKAVDAFFTPRKVSTISPHRSIWWITG